MLSWANFYRGLANEATLRAAEMANSSDKDKLEEVAKEWSALVEWSSEGIDTPDARQARAMLL